jgi:hypothetical protein
MNQIEIYQTKDKQTQVDVSFQEETVWLTQKQITTLFGKDRTVITKHIRNIFKERELEEKVVCANFAHTTQHGTIKGKTQETTVNITTLPAVQSNPDDKWS